MKAIRFAASSGVTAFASSAAWISKNAAIHAGTGLTPPILADCTEPLSEGSNFLDVLPAWMLIHP